MHTLVGRYYERNVFKVTTLTLQLIAVTLCDNFNKASNSRHYIVCNRQTCELILKDAIAMKPYASTVMSKTLRATLVWLTTVVYVIIVRVFIKQTLGAQG